MKSIIVLAYIIFAVFAFCEAREVELKALPETREVVGENEERLKKGKDIQQRILELRLLRELSNTLRMKVAHHEQPGINQEIIALTDRMVQSSSRAEIFFCGGQSALFLWGIRAGGFRIEKVGDGFRRSKGDYGGRISRRCGLVLEKCNCEASGKESGSCSHV